MGAKCVPPSRARGNKAPRNVRQTQSGFCSNEQIVHVDLAGDGGEPLSPCAPPRPVLTPVAPEPPLNDWPAAFAEPSQRQLPQSRSRATDLTINLQIPKRCCTTSINAPRDYAQGLTGRMRSA